MYQVEWLKPAVTRILAAWGKAPPDEQDIIKEAADAIDRELRASPMTVGESHHSQAVRVTSQLPVTVWFSVDEQTQVVRVFTATVYYKRS